EMRKALADGNDSKADQALYNAKQLAIGRSEEKGRVLFLEALFNARNRTRGVRDLFQQAPGLLAGPVDGVGPQDQMELVGALTDLAERQPDLRKDVRDVLSKAAAKLPQAAGYAAYVGALAAEDTSRGAAASELVKTFGPDGVS